MERNKKIVLDFYRHVFWEGNLTALKEFAADDVAVHAPTVGHGLDALADSVLLSFTGVRPHRADSAGMPEPAFLIADGDVVVVCFAMPQPEPAGDGTVFDYFSFDAFRVRDGRIVERWPSINKAAPTHLTWTHWADPARPAGSAGGPADGTGPEAAKRLAVDFYRQVFDAQNATAVRDFVTEDYQQYSGHLPSGRDGLEGLVGALFPDGPRPVPEPMTLPPAILAAEGDVVVSAGLLPQPEPANPSRRYPYYVFDAYRVRAGRIAAHWSGVNKHAPPQHT